jgi:hypothetical protein
VLPDGLGRLAGNAPASFEDRHSPLALDHGIAMYTASLAWAKRTINILAREGAGPAESR